MTTAEVTRPTRRESPSGSRRAEPRGPIGPRLRRHLSRTWLLYLMVLPGLIHLVLFKIAPVGAVVIAFQKYSPFLGITGSPWVGLDNFVQFLEDPLLGRLLTNTIALAVLSLVIGFPIPIIFSLFLNEIRTRWVKRTVQTSSFLPYFISTAVIVSIMFTLLSPRGGLVNQIIEFFGGEAIFFFAEPEWFRPLYVFMGVWMSFGYNTIIYMAAMSAIDPTLYEAAEIDGANRWRRMWHVTLPSISNMIVVMLILAIGQILSVDMERILLSYRPSTYETADVIATYVYRLAFAPTGFPNYSYGAAVGLVQGVIALVLILTANRVAKRYSETRIF
ncbi:ABC transporter permease [Pseudactinotalea sp.]|uniref:ABC transporter permease n=1 Tax=Pseudactinotalea sp. TaxID=1926260 RepID=UPI003B3B40B2